MSVCRRYGDEITGLSIEDFQVTEEFVVRRSQTLNLAFISVKPASLHEVVGKPDGKPLPTTRAFLISGYEKSVAQRVGATTQVGTISVSIKASWDPKQNPPADEFSGTGKSVATSQGRDINQKYRKIPRKFGKVRTVLNVRYEK